MKWLPTKKAEIIRLGAELFIVILIVAIVFPKAISALNLSVLTATFAALIWYAYDTHRIANQGAEASLRPIILRSGFIKEWEINSTEDIEKGSGEMNLEFTTLRNIAKNIRGYIILEKRKYTLLFANEISPRKITKSQLTVGITPKWGWLAVGDKLYATFTENKFEEIERENQVYLMYEDIEGNSYFTEEDDNFYQTQGKV